MSTHKQQIIQGLDQLENIQMMTCVPYTNDIATLVVITSTRQTINVEGWYTLNSTQMWRYNVELENIAIVTTAIAQHAVERG